MPLRVLICNIFNLANKHHAKALGLDQSMPLWSPQIESWLPDTPPPRSPFSIDNLILTFAVNRQTARCLPGWGLPRLRGQLGITKQNDFYPSLQVPPPSSVSEYRYMCNRCAYFSNTRPSFVGRGHEMALGSCQPQQKMVLRTVASGTKSTLSKVTQCRLSHEKHLTSWLYYWDFLILLWKCDKS